MASSGLQKNNRLIAQMFFGLVLLIFSITLVAPPALAQTLSQDDQNSIYNDTVWYDPASGGASSTGGTDFCLGGPGGSGPLYGPTFPKISDTAALSAAIKSYISNTVPSSPLAAFSDAYVAFGLQYNVNPVLVLAITQKETSLGTAGYGTPPKFNVGNIRGSGDSTGFVSYSGYPTGIEAIYKNLRTGLYLDPPANDTTISQIMNTYAPPSDNNDTAGYIQFIGDVMKKVFGDLKNIPTDVSNDNCATGLSNGSGPVAEGSNSALAQKILDYRSTGQYSCDNPGDCADLQKVVSGQSLSGSDGCQAQTLDPKVLKLILYLIEAGKFKVGTYALCGDHSFDGLGGHSGGHAVDISSVNGLGINQDSAQVANEGLKMDQFLNNLPAAISLSQQISYGYGNHYYQPMAALQQYNGQLCGQSCVSIYTLSVEQEHENHIHAGY